MWGNNDTSVIEAMAAGGVPGGGENPMLSDRNRAPYESRNMRGVRGQIAHIKGLANSPYKRTSVRGVILGTFYLNTVQKKEEKVSMPCLLFCFGCCGTGAEKVFKK